MIASSELIARVATMKNPTADKVQALQHAIQVNNSEMRFVDPVCLYRNCLHHFSCHNKSWKTPDGKRHTCKCHHMKAIYHESIFT